MSDYSWLTAGLPANLSDTAKPSPKPKAQPKAQATLPSLLARQQQNVQQVMSGNAARDVLARFSDLLEVPFDLIGAAMRDVSEGRNQLLPRQSAMGHLAQRLLHGDLAGARQYSFTSWDTIRRLAKDGNPLAKEALRHPRIAAVFLGGSEFLNPANALAGEGIGRLGALAKAGAGKAGASVADAWRARATAPEETLRSPTYRVLKNLGSVVTLRRLGPLRQAAHDVAIERGATEAQAKAAADRAEVIGRRMIMATEIGKAEGQRLLDTVMRGLSPQQKLEFIDLVESGAGTATMNKIAREHGWPVPSADMQTRLDMYRKWRKAIDARSVKNKLAEPGELWSGPKYFPRRGMTMHPDVENSEELGNLEEEIEARRSRGGANIRRDTLSKNIPSRKYGTRVQAIANGVTLNPEWDPAEALYQHAIARVRNNELEEGARGLADLGLAVPLVTERSVGPDLMHRPDFLPFTKLGTVRQFGSPTLRESAVHPAVADFIEDLGSQTSSGGLATLADVPWMVFDALNRAASRVLVSQPGYHIPVNVIPNATASLVTKGADVPALVKALLRPRQAIEEAQTASADFPYASRTFNVKDLQPWSSLTRKERMSRIARTPSKVLDAFSNELLYKHMQPRIAAAAYKGLEKKLGPDAAALEVRSILGEPENLAARERGWASAIMFPGWQKSQIRRWAGLLGLHPELYQALHTGINAANARVGVSPDDYSWAQFIPPIALSRDPKTGKVRELPIPSPANRALGFIDAFGNIATGNPNVKQLSWDFANMLNPALGAAARAFWTVGSQEGINPGKEPSNRILFDKDAPADVQRNQFIENVLGRFNPARPAEGGGAYAGSLVGLTPRTELTPDQRKLQFRIETMFREGMHARGRYVPGIEYYRAQADKARKSGDAKLARQLDATADAMYRQMEATLRAYGVAPNP